MGIYHTGYFYGKTEEDSSGVPIEKGPFSTTHLCYVWVDESGEHRVDPPICGTKIVGQRYRPFRALATAMLVHQYRGSIIGSDVGCPKCRKKLLWCVLHDVVEQIEYEHD